MRVLTSVNVARCAVPQRFASGAGSSARFRFTSSNGANGHDGNASSSFFPPALGKFSQGWVLMLARGMAAVLFGLWTMAFPGFGLVALLLLFGMYAVFDGALALALAIGDGEGVRDRW